MFWSRGTSVSKQSQQQAQSPSLEDAPTCRIIVAGNPGVGKTSFVHLLANGSVLANPHWTCGCQLEIVAHMFENQAFAMELWDVGANPKFKKSRRVFYKSSAPPYSSGAKDKNVSDIDGLILVHDLSNKKSFANLTGWMREVMREISNTNEVVWDNDLLFNGGNNSLPVLLVGTKADLVSLDSRSIELLELGVDSVDISTQFAETFASDSNAFAKISSFFDKVVINRENQSLQMQQSGHNNSYDSIAHQQESLESNMMSQAQNGASTSLSSGLGPTSSAHGSPLGRYVSPPPNASNPSSLAQQDTFEQHLFPTFTPVTSAQYPPTTRNQRPSALPRYFPDSSDPSHFSLPHSRQSATTYTNILDAP